MSTSAPPAITAGNKEEANSMTVKQKKSIAELTAVFTYALAFGLCGGISCGQIALSAASIGYIVLLMAAGAIAAYKAGWTTGK